MSDTDAQEYNEWGLARFHFIQECDVTVMSTFSSVPGNNMSYDV